MPARSLCCRALERRGLGDRGSEGAVPALQGFLVALQQGGTRCSECRHFFRYAEITDAELPEHRLHIGGELIHELLGDVARFRSVSLERWSTANRLRERTTKRPSSVSGTPKP